jgi:hypothetical protein
VPRFITVLSLGVLFASLALGAPVPQNVPGPITFFPTRVGDRLVHAIGNGEYTTVVTEVKEIDGGRQVTLSSLLNDGQTVHFQTIEVTPKGLLLTNAHGRGLPEPLWELKLNPKADAVWKGRWPVFCNGEIVFEEQDYTAAGWETVEVPAGKFRAIRVEREGRLDQLTQRTTRWYAPGLGCVKWSSDGSGSVLTAFTPGKE